MIKTETECGVFHETRKSAALARKLLEDGGEEIDLIHKVLKAVLNCQEKDTNSPHQGNFYWMAEDGNVTDLNAVQFVLKELIFILKEFDDSLKEKMKSEMKKAVKLGLQEIENLDVLTAYTNITVYDILNRILGGEYLNNNKIIQKGINKLNQLIIFTAESGTSFEFNSPTYTRLAVRELNNLGEMTERTEIRTKADVLRNRLSLTVMLHYDSGTESWAGPHSRAYVSAIEDNKEAGVQNLIKSGSLPDWAVENLNRKLPVKFQVKETASQERKLGLTTYFSKNFNLGTAVSEFGPQSNNCISYFKVKDGDKNNNRGIFYTRYMKNNRWLGDFYHKTDRSKSRNFIDQGKFYSVQNNSRIIAVYSPGKLEQVKSAGAALIWNNYNYINKIIAGENQVENFPYYISEDELVIIECDKIYLAVKPLTLTSLGKKSGIYLDKRGQSLVLKLENYKGQEKDFWETRWPGAFYQGHSVNSYFLEVAEKEDYAGIDDFRNYILNGKFTVKQDPAFTYQGKEERTYTAEYSRDKQKLGLEIDLMKWQLKKRWTEKGKLNWPQLLSPVAKQNKKGIIRVEGAVLKCNQESAWLYGNKEKNFWIAGYMGLEPTPLTLITPEGKVEIESMGMGTVIWKEGKVEINALEAVGTSY
ncbi:MAG: hypothetical protein ACOC1S_03175 [bacterium]